MLNNALPNNSATGANLTSVLGASDLPPGPQPPEDPWYYEIRFSHPTTTLKFRDFEHEDGRNETQVGDLIQQAISASIDPRLHNQLIDQHPYTWQGTQSLVGVEPLRPVPAEDPPHELVGLTHGIWLSSLIGINQFRLAYPGLYFKFEIYVEINEVEEDYVGRGGLLEASELQAPVATAEDVAVTKRSAFSQVGGQNNALPNSATTAVNLTGEPSALLRDETDVEKLIQRAIHFAISDPQQRDQFMNRHQYTWYSDDGDISLGVLPYTPQPSTDPPYAPVGLTYKIWEYSLIGINQFRLAYPGLNFRFEIYINSCVGSGSLESVKVMLHLSHVRMPPNSADLGIQPSDHVLRSLEPKHSARRHEYRV
ncbi:MAG: hypothetical protein OHK93_003780 [Ramalina farinacea]|uniref:Uncharacterized protein n=1 Tax=Ramalina farinacea TaxID=258253 RepID=A0AA43QWF1_9LECA|nr:hypothetical protein [Ramalina farinacea]